MAVAYAQLHTPEPAASYAEPVPLIQYCFRTYGSAGVLDLAGLAVLLTFLG